MKKQITKRVTKKKEKAEEKILDELLFDCEKQKMMIYYGFNKFIRKIKPDTVNCQIDISSLATIPKEKKEVLENIKKLLKSDNKEVRVFAEKVLERLEKDIPAYKKWFQTRMNYVKEYRELKKKNN